MNETTEMINQLTQQPISKDEAASITLIAKRLVNQKTLVEAMEAQLKEAKEVLRAIEMDELPNAMQEVGLTSLTLAGGLEIEVQTFYSCSVSDEHPTEKASALAWLRDNKHGDLIKHEFKVQLGTTSEQKAKSLTAWCLENKAPFKSSESVNAQTLKSFMKERLTAGKEFPMSIFRAYSGNKAVVKQ